MYLLLVKTTSNSGDSPPVLFVGPGPTVTWWMKLMPKVEIWGSALRRYVKVFNLLSAFVPVNLSNNLTRPKNAFLGYQLVLCVDQLSHRVFDSLFSLRRSQFSV